MNKSKNKKTNIICNIKTKLLGDIDIYMCTFLYTIFYAPNILNKIFKKPINKYNIKAILYCYTCKYIGVCLL